MASEKREDDLGRRSTILSIGAGLATVFCFQPLVRAIFVQPAESPATVPVLIPPPRAPQFSIQMRAGSLVERAFAFYKGGLDARALADVEAALKLVPDLDDAIELKRRLLAFRDVERLSAAAGAGDTLAMCHLAYLYKGGHGIKKDLLQSAQWWKKAAECDDRTGIYGFGLALLNGRGIEKDAAHGLQLLRKSAEKGSSKAMLALAYTFRDGNGVPEDMTEALVWFRNAAYSTESCRDRGQACADIGVIYLLGWKVEKDINQALAWTAAAVRYGNAGAMRNTGEIFTGRYGFENDPEAASAWREAAVEAGEAELANRLGVRFASADKDDLQSRTRAAFYFRKAAEFGCVEGMANLASCYFEGSGVLQDDEEGRRWMKAAADAGDAVAAKWLKEH